MKFLEWKKFGETSKTREIKAEFINTPELLDTIQEMYQAKHKFDLICQKNAESRKSMGQFIFLFFKDKHESSELTIEQSYNFINSIFINLSHVEVALFMSILRNEIEEEFAGVFYKVKCDIEDDFREMRPKEDSGQADKLETTDVLDGFVRFETALAILDRRYPEEYPFLGEIRAQMEEAVREENKRKALKESMKVKSQKPKLRLRVKKEEQEEPPKLFLFADFVKILMNFELKNHRIFLSFLASEFKNVDSDNFGFISRKKFISLVKGIFKKLNKKVDPKKMLMKRGGFDPFVVTFSETVKMFEKKKIKHENESFNLLEIINLSIAS